MLSLNDAIESGKVEVFSQATGEVIVYTKEGNVTIAGRRKYDLLRSVSAEALRKSASLRHLLGKGTLRLVP